MNDDYISRRLTLDDLKPYLTNLRYRGKEIVAGCPICEAGDPKAHHLYIDIGAGDKLVMHCQKCEADFRELMQAFRDMGAKHEVDDVKPRVEIEKKVYEYTNPDGTIAYFKLRRKFDDGSKDFSAFHYDKHGNRKWSFPKGCNTLYNLEGLEEASKQADVPILYIVEGEKCCEAMLDAGFVATTSNTGARKKIDFTDVDREMLSRFPVKIIIPDADEKGYEYVEAWPDVDVLPLPEIWPECPKKGDVADYFTAGGDIETIREWRAFKLDDESIGILERKDFIDENLFKALTRIRDKVERARTQSMLEMKAQELKCAQQFKRNLKAYLLKIAIEKGGKQSNKTHFKHAPIGDLECGEWIADMAGIRRLVEDETGQMDYDYASFTPITISSMLRNIENGMTKIAVSFYDEESWKTVNVERKKLTNVNDILELANLNVDVNSETAKSLIRYLACIVNSNGRDKLPSKKSVSHLGWVGNKFVPFDEEYALDSGREHIDIVSALEEQGDFDEWVEFVKPLRENIYLRMVLNASFASVLLEKVEALPFILHLWGGTGSGKAQPLNTKIITPYGFKLMKDVKIGDKVIGGDGLAHTVIGVYPQGVKDVYELTFGDGRKTKCCKEHLWNVTTRTRRNKGRGYITLELQEMLKRAIKDNKGYQYQIPLCKPVDFNQKEDLPISPYLLGALIGDGCLTLKPNPANKSTSIYFCNTESDVIENVHRELQKNDSGLRFNKYTQCQHVVTNAKWLKEAIKSLGLNVRSAKRFIPEIYLYAGIEERQELLRGLMDTDGNVSDGRVSYSTLSERLANDVKALAYSLGYRASICKTFREQRQQFEYSVSIATKNNDVFSSVKHTNRFAKAKENKNRTLMADALPIVKVEACGREECQCIMLDSDDHTYLCDDYIVTHNTVSMLVAASIWGNPAPGKLFKALNGTPNYICQQLCFLKNLPFFGDELQTLKRDFNGYDNLIMRLTEGTNRGRLNKNSIIQDTPSWKNILITTGEETCTQENSGGGTKNRVIEIECKNVIVEDGHGVSLFVKNNYGTAGRRYLGYLKDYDLTAEFRALQKQLAGMGSTAKQYMAMAVLLLADKITSEKIFHTPMLTIDDVGEFLKEDIEVNKAERAYEALLGLIEEHRLKFNTDDSTEISTATLIWGKINPRQVAFVSTVCIRELRRMGYEFDAVKEYWLRKGYIVKGGNGKFSHNIRIVKGGANVRCIIINRPSGIWAE